MYQELLPWHTLSTVLRSHHDEVIQDWIELLNSGAGERLCLEFLRNHAGFFFCDSARRLTTISELELGADYRPDFVVADDCSSYGLLYEFFEIEDPNENPYTSKGNPSARLSGAIAQIQNWQMWLESNREMAKKILPSFEFWRKERLATRFTVIIGRRSEKDKWTHLRNYFADKVNIQIRSFDYLTDKLKERQFSPLPILASSEMDRVDIALRNQLANPFRMAIPSSSWRGAAANLYHYHTTAHGAEILVSLAETNYRLKRFIHDWNSLPQDERAWQLRAFEIFNK